MVKMSARYRGSDRGAQVDQKDAEAVESHA